MIKVAFCDDEPVILEQITALLEKYKEQRCRDMEYAAFRSPLELLAEMENKSEDRMQLCFCYMMDLFGIITDKMPKSYFSKNDALSD